MQCIFFLLWENIQFEGIELKAAKSYASVHVPIKTSHIQFNFPKNYCRKDNCRSIIQQHFSIFVHHNPLFLSFLFGLK